ncbi:MAG: DUF1732 domain-containing protein [bacterium]|nr:DUF1732 domain-containing protein [bacterium]
MKSMTGFSQGRLEFNNISLNLYFKSLNHKFLDILYKGTGFNHSTEKMFKEIIKEKVFRGKLEVVFDLFDANQSKCNIQFNEQLSSEILNELSRITRRYKDVSLSLDSLLRIPMIFRLDYQPDNFKPDEKEEIQRFVEGVFAEFLQSREEEGKSILEDVLASIGKIETELADLEKSADDMEQELFRKFKEKMNRFLRDYEVDDRRVLQEAAILAEKSCINEEIRRLSTHGQRIKELLTDPAIEIKGREADFLAQEMQRETHTIASKTTSMEVHKRVLNIRREIEKIKQQVQNVE